MTRLRPILLPWLILVAALSVTWLVWDHERESSRKALRSQFDFSLRESVSRVEQRMAAYEQMLRGVQGFFAATGKIDRDSFRDYVGSLQLDANFSGIQAIGVAEQVSAARKENHIAAMRRLGFADYAIQPGGQRASYAPIIQIEPYISRNRIPTGFDAWSNAARQLAMEKARDSGMAAISGKVRLAVDDDSDAPAGFVMYLPIYARGQPLDSVAMRRTHLTGWVFAAFRMHDLMASLYGEQVPGLALAIYDGVEPSVDALLYRTVESGEQRQSSALQADEYLVVGGHTWTLSMRALDDFEARFGRNAATLIAIAGSGLSLLLALLAWLMATGRARAMRLAATMTKELRESEQRWAFALEGAGDGVWDWNLKTRAAETSRRWKEIVDCNNAGGCGKGSGIICDACTIDDWEARIHPDDQSRVGAAMRATLSAAPDDNATSVAEYRVRCESGQWKWVLSRGMVVERDAEGRPLRMIGTLSDISARKASEEHIHHLARHDALTDLPNRALFSDRLQQELTRAKRHSERFALFFLDLDNFKPINDNYGHAVGDLMLQLVARRLQDSVRESDTVGRIGGDEFVVLMPGLADPHDALALAEKVRKSLRQPFSVDGRELSISCSLGVAVFPDDGSDEISLTKSADNAMYRAKENGRDNVRMGKTAP